MFGIYRYMKIGDKQQLFILIGTKRKVGGTKKSYINATFKGEGDDIYQVPTDAVNAAFLIANKWRKLLMKRGKVRIYVDVLGNDVNTDENFKHMVIGHDIFLKDTREALLRWAVESEKHMLKCGYCDEIIFGKVHTSRLTSESFCSEQCKESYEYDNINEIDADNTSYGVMSFETEDGYSSRVGNGFDDFPDEDGMLDIFDME